MSFQEYRRRSLVPLAGILLACVYLFLFLPMSRWSNGLDKPLDDSWRKLTISLGRSNTVMIDFRHLTNQLAETRQALAQLEAAKKVALNRLTVAPALRAKMSAPFQLVDYEDERGKRLENLGKLAKEKQVTIDPAVSVGFPEHTAEIRERPLLWAAMFLADDLLSTAMRCKVTAIHSLEVPLDLTNAPPHGTFRWAEIPLQIELTAPADCVTRFVQSLPLNPEEIHAAGLPDAAPTKALLFIDRLIMRKQSPDKLDEVRLWIRTIGYIPRE